MKNKDYAALNQSKTHKVVRELAPQKKSKEEQKREKTWERE